MVVKPIVSRFLIRQIGDDPEVSCLSLRVLPVEPDVVVPKKSKLKEIINVVDAPVAGYHVQCPHCEQELRISKKYAGMPVACKFCSGQFKLDINSSRLRTKAFYVGCPHCNKELRVAPKYIGMNVACKFCEGHVKIVSNSRPSERVAAEKPVNNRVSQHSGRRR